MAREISTILPTISAGFFKDPTFATSIKRGYSRWDSLFGNICLKIPSSGYLLAKNEWSQKKKESDTKPQKYTSSTTTKTNHYIRQKTLYAP